mmetsp:Transcript_118683/g.343281  ORF Transcript_118683/g.343281 Transcript_118683/m.343281 type:complete len:219 (+) Transcript_118683:2204-2860(+)
MPDVAGLAGQHVVRVLEGEGLRDMGVHGSQRPDRGVPEPHGRERVARAGDGVPPKDRRGDDERGGQCRQGGRGHLLEVARAGGGHGRRREEGGRGGIVQGLRQGCGDAHSADVRQDPLQQGHAVGAGADTTTGGAGAGGGLRRRGEGARGEGRHVHAVRALQVDRGGRGLDAREPRGLLRGRPADVHGAVEVPCKARAERARQMSRLLHGGRCRGLLR